MRKFKTKKNTKELSKIIKTKKKILNPFSLQPLTDAYQNFKKRQRKEIANKIKREKIEQQKQLLQEKKQKIIEENQKIKDEEKRLKDIEVKWQNEENQKIKEEKERIEAKEKLRLDNENQQKKKWRTCT